MQINFLILIVQSISEESKRNMIFKPNLKGIFILKISHTFNTQVITSCKVCYSVSATGVIVGYGAPVLTAAPGIEALVKIVYPTSPGGGGSCPYIYSWDGNDYKLEGEAFGTALGRALETQTSIVLKDLKSSDNRLKLKLTNERPETHFFNDIKLVAIETDEQ